MGGDCREEFRVYVPWVRGSRSAVLEPNQIAWAQLAA